MTGAPRKLAFPQACASCGRPAGRRLRVEKVFTHAHGSGPATYRVVGVEVPFCTACVERHRTEVKHLAPVQGIVSLLRSVLLIPAVGFVLVALALIPAVGHSVADGNWSRVWLFLGLVLGFALVGILCARAAVRQTHRYRVTDPTDVTSAFDFTDNLSAKFERERHNYELKNNRFAEAFVAVNASRIWHGEQRRSRSVDRGRAVALWLVLSGGALLVGWLGLSALRG
jgi:hypothetical protein